MSSTKSVNKRDDGPIVEPAKPILFARGGHSSQTVKDLLSDFTRLKKTVSKTLTTKHDFLPMEDESGMEFLCTKKSDSGLFFFAHENKKRPNNFVLGRMFDTKVLDMVELGVKKCESMQACQARAGTSAASAYQSPLLLFQGEQFANATDGSPLSTLQSLFLDVFSNGNRAKEMDLEALDLVLVFTATGSGEVEMKGYRIAFGERSADSQSPQIVLQEHGPNATFEIRRTKIAAPDLAKLARKQPKLAGSVHSKNVSSDPLRGLVGQIHMKKQDTNKLVMRSRFKRALKKRPADDEGKEGKQSGTKHGNKPKKQKRSE